MAKYYLGIDETGNFNILKPEGSFVCGVLTQISQTDLDALYIKTYNEIKIPKVTAINEVLPNVQWDTYHREIKKQLDDYVNKQTPSDKCKYSITFQNDAVNSFVNFADICCGILKSKEYRTKVADKVSICSEKNQIAQLRQIISGLQGKEEKEKSRLMLERQRAEQLEQKAQEELKQREEIQKEKEKIQEEKDGLKDEIQDFTREEIQGFIKAARKNYFFFGDTAQSIYGGLKTTMSIKELSEITGLQSLMLYNNYRLPKPVAKITQQYIGIDVNPYSETAYKSTETNLPLGTVIIPMFDGATSNDRKKSLYVAMTRTYRDLFVLYTGELKTPLKEIDKSLYLSNF
jgi:hypothetical protein